MTIKLIGDTFKATQRVITGLSSLDWALGDALGNTGWPVGVLTEVYGPKNCGKTSFCMSLMGILATDLQKDVVLLDWEGQAQETILGLLGKAGFDGTINYILNLADEKSEDTLARFVQALYDKNQPIALMDSIGGFRPTAYMEGSLSDSNMGVFAREMGRFSDWVIAALQRSSNKGNVFMTNHVHPTIGSYVAGQDTAGGVKKKYLAQVRIDLKRTFLKTKKDANDKESGSVVDLGESWLLGGRIDSSRVGYSKREFNVYMVGGEGIHKGLTAMFDCVVQGLAEVSSKRVTESATISMGNKTYGKMRTILEHRTDDELFYDFTNALIAGSDTVSTQPQKKTRKRRK